MKIKVVELIEKILCKHEWVWIPYEHNFCDYYYCRKCGKVKRF